MATNFDDLGVIRTRFLDAWETLDPAIPYVFDLTRPPVEPEGIWARVSVMPGSERRRSIARRTYEQLGRVYLQVFAPVGVFDDELWAVAEHFATTFRDWLSDDGRIRFDTPEFRLTPATGGNDHMLVVSIPYTAQH